VDTGAAKTLISQELAETLRIPIENLLQRDWKLLFTADGTRMYLRNKTILPLQINELTFQKEAYVVKSLSHGLILGMDFLDQTGAVVDCRRRVVTFNDANVDVGLQRVRRDYGDEPVAYARSLRTVCLPPMSEALVEISVPRRFNGCSVLLETSPSLQFRPFGCARAIVHCDRNRSVCKILNPTLKTLTLHRNKNLAVIERLDSIASCQPYQNQAETAPQQDFTVRESREVLDKFNNEYCFKINPDLPDTQKYELLQVLWDNRRAFARDMSEIGVYKGYEMKLQAMSNRKCYRRQYRLALDDAAEVERQLNDLKSRGVLEPTENSEYNSPVFLVEKKGGAKRLVVDLRMINEILIPHLLPLPKIDELLNEISLAGSQYLSTFDLFSGFLQLGVEKASRKFLAITNPVTNERLTYTRVPFGLQQSPACLIKVLNIVFSGNRQGSGTWLYMDDLCCSGRDWQHHLSVVNGMLQKLRINNLCCNPTKCCLAYSELSFLGHSISSKGIRIAKEKFAVINKISPPKNRKSLQRLMGLLNFFRKFVQNFSHRTANMRRLLKADQLFQWTDKCQAELDDLKNCLLSDPLLRPLDPSKRIVVLTDASDFGYGFSILQKAEDGKLHPVFYGGASLSPAEEKHTPAHKELGALVLAFRSIEHLASLVDICVFTDNSSVLYYRKWTPQTARLKRIICYLQQFSFEIRHVPGCKNLAADYLSRCYDDMTYMDRVELQRKPDHEEFLVTADFGPPNPIRAAPLIDAQPTSDETVTELLAAPATHPRPTEKIAVNKATQTRQPAATQCDDPTGKTDGKGEYTETAHDAVLTQDMNGDSCLALATATDTVTPNAQQDDRLDNHTMGDIEGTTETTVKQIEDVGLDGQLLAGQSADPCPTETDRDQDEDEAELSDGWLDGDAEINADIDENNDQDELTQRIDSEVNHIYTDAEAGFTEQDYLEDAEFGDMYRYLKDGTLTGNERTDKTILLASEFYFLRHNQPANQGTALLYKIKPPKGKRDLPLTIDRLCAPKKTRAEILFRSHDVCVHGGRLKTYLTISNRFYWKNLFSDVHQYVKSCDTCQKSRRNYAHRVAPLHPLQVPKKPFTHLSIDFKNLTRRTAEGNVAILVIVDQFSNYPFLIPTKDMTAATTARALIEHVICSEGLPSVINSDRGVNFTADLFRYLARFLHIKHRISASKSCRTNGAAEQCVQRLSQMLRRFEGDDLTIEQCLPLISLGLRASSLTRLRYSPYEITRARRMYLGGPLDMAADIPFDGDVGKYIAVFRRELDQIHRDVRRTKCELKQEDAAAYNRHNKARQTDWQVGDKVLLLDKTIKVGSNKVLTKKPYIGPFWISEIAQGEGYGATYRLIDVETGRTYKHLVNQDRLKRYYDSYVELAGRLQQVPRKAQLKPIEAQLSDDDDGQIDGQVNEDSQTDAQVDDLMNNDGQQTDIPATMYGFEPAVRIKKQRISKGQLEYLVEYEDGTDWWSSQVSDPLLRQWRLKQAKERARKARCRRRAFK